MESKLYKIKELESLSGIKAHTLRIWEKRYKILNPIRTKTNLRRYSQEDLNRIISVSILYNYGWKISKVATLSDDELNLHCDEALDKQAGSYAEMAELIFAVNSFDITSFDKQLAKYYEKFGHERVLVSIVAPMVERLALLSVLNRLDKVIEEFFLNRLMVNIIELAANFPATNNKHAKKILIIQSQQNLIPVNHAIVNLLSLISDYSVVVYYNVIENEYLKRINSLFKPDFVFTEFSKSSSDDKVLKRAKAMSKAFKNSSVFFCGKKVELLSKKLPDGVYYVENVRDFYRIM
jgi:MerR family transcriptional regulator, light-induced transcriptional regulator